MFPFYSATKIKIKKNVPNVAVLMKQESTPPDKKEITMNGDSNNPVIAGIRKGGDDSIFSTIDAVISQSVTDSPSGQVATPIATPTPINTPTVDPENAPPMPTGVPTSVEDLIKQIKQAAHESEIGKCKFFNTAVNRMLLV